MSDNIYKEIKDKVINCEEKIWHEELLEGPKECVLIKEAPYKEPVMVNEFPDGIVLFGAADFIKKDEEKGIISFYSFVKTFNLRNDELFDKIVNSLVASADSIHNIHHIPNRRSLGFTDIGYLDDVVIEAILHKMRKLEGELMVEYPGDFIDAFCKELKYVVIIESKILIIENRILYDSIMKGFERNE